VQEGPMSYFDNVQEFKILNWPIFIIVIHIIYYFSKQTTETSHVVLSKTVVQDTESETEVIINNNKYLYDNNALILINDFILGMCR
jgi:hypothetical protein